MRGRVVERAGALGAAAPWEAPGRGMALGALEALGRGMALGALEALGREAGLDGARAQDSGESAPPPFHFLTNGCCHGDAPPFLLSWSTNPKVRE